MARIIEVSDETVRTLNPKVYTIRKDLETKSILTQILIKDETGKPKLDLISREKTVVHTPSQKDYWDLMRVYECGSWKWTDTILATQENYWTTFRKGTCLDMAVDFPSEIYDEDMFGFGDREFYQEKNWNIISVKEFYGIQKITPEILKEIKFGLVKSANPLKK